MEAGGGRRCYLFNAPPPPMGGWGPARGPASLTPLLPYLPVLLRCMKGARTNSKTEEDMVLLHRDCSLRFLP